VPEYKEFIESLLVNLSFIVMKTSSIILNIFFLDLVSSVKIFFLFKDFDNSFGKLFSNIKIIKLIKYIHTIWKLKMIIINEYRI
jgi:hypothetical protein